MTTATTRPQPDADNTFPDSPEAYREATWNTTIRALFGAAVAQAESRIAWYEKSGKQKAAVAKGLRWWSLFLFAVGTLSPILLTFLIKVAAVAGIGGTNRQAWNWVDWVAAIPLAEVGYVLLASAGALVVFDQFFDASGSWIRFRQSQARLEVLLADFRFGWAELMTKAGGTFADRAAALEATTMIRTFVSKVEILAEEETKEWARRFNARIEAFDRNPNLKIRLDGESSGDTTPTTTGRSGEPASGSQATSQARSIPASAPAAEATARANVFIRLAIDEAETLDPHSLQLSLDEVPIPVPSNGLLELPLEVGDAHRLVATGRRNGKSVAGQLAMTPSLEDEGRPFAIALA